VHGAKIKSDWEALLSTAAQIDVAVPVMFEILSADGM
jgi:hypothetical protein